MARITSLEMLQDIRSRAQQAPLLAPKPTAVREQLEDDVAAFLAAGGRIETVPRGMSGEAAAAAARSKQAQNGGRASREKQGGAATLGVSAAAEFLGESQQQLVDWQNGIGEGPPFYRMGMVARYRATDLQIFKQTRDRR